MSSTDMVSFLFFRFQKVAMLAEMEESIFKKKSKTELLDMKPKIEPKPIGLEFHFGRKSHRKRDESFFKEEPTITEHLDKKPKTEPKEKLEFQVGLENMNASIFKKELKTELSDMKPKIEPKKELEFQAGLAVLEKMDESFFKKELTINENIDKKPKIEPKEDLEFQAGLTVLENMDELSFKKEPPKTEPLDKKPNTVCPERI